MSGERFSLTNKILDAALCQRHDTLPNLRNWLRVSKRAYEMRIDVLSVKAH